MADVNIEQFIPSFTTGFTDRSVLFSDGEGVTEDNANFNYNSATRTLTVNTISATNLFFTSQIVATFTVQTLLKIPDGTVNNPGTCFELDTDTGFYRIGANNLGVATQGVKRLDIANSLIQSTVPFAVPDGSLANPSLAFSSQPALGFRRKSASVIAASVGAIDDLIIDCGAHAVTVVNLSTSAGGPGFVQAAGAITTSNATAGFGYATGAGGTVTQNTNKSTGVTLNKATGEITMNGAALAGDTTVSFTLTNSALAVGDYLLVQHVSAGTVGAYKCEGVAAGGSGTITVRNITTGSLSEAIVLKFMVLKSVTA